MAYHREDTSKIADLLDWAELLPQYLETGRDNTGDFRKAVVAIVKLRPGLHYFLDLFDRSHGQEPTDRV